MNNAFRSLVNNILRLNTSYKNATKCVYSFSGKEACLINNLVQNIFMQLELCIMKSRDKSESACHSSTSLLPKSNLLIFPFYKDQKKSFL